MKHLAILIGVVYLWLALVSSSFAATVKKKNGEIVEGTITGLIVQRGEVKETEEEGKKKYTVSYSLTNGSEIGAIDEEGVHRISNKIVFFVVSQEDKPIDDDVDAVNTAVNMPSGPFVVGYTKAGGTVIRVGARSASSEGVNEDALLGEFRKEGEEGRIIPALEIKTASGETITVPISDIVEFKKKPTD